MNFTLTPAQVTKINAWEPTHKCTIRDSGAIGGKLEFSFAFTGIGVAAKAKCACGAELDVTDYENW